MNICVKAYQKIDKRRGGLSLDPLLRCKSSVEINIEDSTDSGKGGGDPVFTTDVATCGLRLTQSHWETPP